jgi:hypothetical protein
MAGLLDTQNINPLALGLLGAGGAVLSGRRGIAQAPQAFAGGLMQGQQMQQAQRAAALREQMAAQQMDMQRQELGLQQGRYGMDQQRFAAEQTAAAARAADDARVREIRSRFIEQARQTDPQLARLAEVDFPEAVKQAFPKKEWRTWFDANTGQQTQGYVAPGMAPQVVGGAQRSFEKVDDGQNIRFLEPYAQTAPIQRQMTPGEMQSARDAAAGRDVTIRGQDLTDRRARENEGKPTYDAATGMWMYQPTGRNPTGAAVRAVGPDGKPLPPKLNEGQATSFVYADRAQQADRIVNGLFQGDRTPSVRGVAIKEGLEGVPLIGGSLGSGANYALSNESQQYEQAKRDFINAVLRRESGAVIADSEFANANRQYFPQPGDGAAVIAQKAENRRRAVEGIGAGTGPMSERFAPGAAQQPAQPARPPGGSGWSIQQVP